MPPTETFQALEAVAAGQILAMLANHFKAFESSKEHIYVSGCQVARIDKALLPVTIVAPPNSLNTVSYALSTEDSVQNIIINHSEAAIHGYTETHLRLNSGQGQRDDTFSLQLATQENLPNIYPYLKIINSKGLESTNSAVFFPGKIDAAIILVGLQANDNSNGYWFGGLIQEK